MDVMDSSKRAELASDFVPPEGTPVSPRILALDVGDERIGLALSDDAHLIASPAGIIVRSKGQPARKVAELARRHGVESVVVGMPQNADRTFGPQARKAQNFAERLAEQLQQLDFAVPIHFWDEYLSTQEALELRRQSGGSRKKAQQPIDAYAAAVILQEYLDHQRKP